MRNKSTPLLLSLVTIMRDSSRDIGTLIESCSGVVDEIVLCDTGSRDSSMKVARDAMRRHGYPTKIYRYKWHDDFAAAKNFAIGQAKGKWLLLLDSDEYLTDGTRKNLRPIVERLVAGDIRDIEMNIIPGQPAEILDAVANDFALPSSAPAAPLSGKGSVTPPFDIIELWRHNIERDGAPVVGEADDLAVRLMRNIPSLRYVGEVHEQIVRADGSQLISGRIAKEKILVNHTGYQKGANEEKINRNYRILSNEEKNGGSTFLLDFYLAGMRLSRGEYEAAARSAEAAIHGHLPVHDRFAGYRLLYRALDAIAEKLRDGKGATAQCGEAGSDDALAAAERRIDDALERGIAAFPDYPDFYYFRGGRMWNAGREREGLADMERAERLADEFEKKYPDQENHFVELMAGMKAALKQMREEK